MSPSTRFSASISPTTAARSAGSVSSWSARNLAPEFSRCGGICAGSGEESAGLFLDEANHLSHDNLGVLFDRSRGPR